MTGWQRKKDAPIGPDTLQHVGDILANLVGGLQTEQVEVAQQVVVRREELQVQFWQRQARFAYSRRASGHSKLFTLLFRSRSVCPCLVCQFVPRLLQTAVVPCRSSPLPMANLLIFAAKMPHEAASLGPSR